MAMMRMLMSLALAAMAIKLAMAANHTVGGTNGGWDTSTNFQTWSSSQSFLVGDKLIFQYTQNHDVLEVTKANFDSCQASNPLQTHNGGNTVIPLSSPGKRYFICGTAGHCGQGMKLEIDTLATSATPPASPPQASPSTPPPSSPVTPVSSPAPKASAPTLAQSPESDSSPSSSRTLSPDVPSTESPANSPFAGDLLPPPPPSSANKDGIQTTLIIGLSIALVMMLHAI